MRLQAFLPFTLFLYLSFLNSGKATSINDTVVTDLPSSSSSQTQTDASSWSLSSTACSTCNKVFTIPSNACGVPQETILGGPNILGPSGSSQANSYFVRDYPITAFTWTTLAIEFDLWMFYNTVPSSRPSGTDSYIIYIDDNPNTPVGISGELESSCETINYSDSSGISIKAFYKFHVRVLMYHQYYNALTVKILSTINSPSTQISFGLNNLVFYSDDSLDITSSITVANFPCSANSYWTGAACESCHDYCSVCTGPSNNECDACRMGFYSYYNRTCLDTCNAPFTPITSTTTYNHCQKTCPTDFYWFYNKICSTSCDAPLTQSTDANGLKICSNPCYYTDATGVYVNTYLFPDKTCDASCSSPAVIETPYLCETPCANSNDYAFQNGSCTGSCVSPLVDSSARGIFYCNSPCPGEYIYPSGTCETDCASPLVKKDNSADIKFCFTPCANSNDYAFQNGSCTGSCVSPLVDSSALGIFYCNSPCPGEYIYPDGTCETDCTSPLVKKDDSSDIKFCGTPCTNSNDYVFQNGSCSGDCVSLLVGSHVGGILSCNSLCPGEYIYPDGTCETDCTLVKKDDSDDIRFCLIPCENFDDYYFTDETCDSTCPFPLESKTEAGIKYCYNPCTINGTYLYDNGTCLATCPSPNILRTKSMGKFCNFPCSDTALYFYWSDGSCQATCDYPNSAIESPLPKTCTLGLSQDDVEEVKKLAGVTDTAESVSSGGILLISLLSSSDSTSICMGPFSKMLQYIRFLDIVYPAKVQLMLESQANKSNTRGFTSKMIGGILDGFPENDDLPEKFEEYRTLSSFFVNFWPALFNLLAILLVILLAVLGNRWSRAYIGVNKIAKNVEEMLKWNVLLITFCGNFCDIFLFTALEFHTTEFTNIQGPISFALCLAINLFVMLVVIKILEVNFAVRRSRKEFKKENVENQEEQLTKEWCSWSALFVAYKGQAYSQQIFLFVFLARLAFFGSVVGYLYQYPLAQAIMINLANISILLYLGIKRPMKQIASFIQQTVLELVLLLFNLCVLVLAILDAKGIDAYDERNQIGSVMVYINLITPMLSAVLMGIKFLFIGVNVYQQWRASKNNKKNAVKRIKRENVSLATGTFPQKVQTRPPPPQNKNHQQLFRQVPSQNGGEGSSVLDITSSSFNGSFVNQDNSNSSFVFHQTRIPQNRNNQQMLRQIPSHIGIEGSPILDISSASLNGISMMNQDQSNSSFVFHQARSPRRQQQQQLMPSSALMRPPQNDSNLLVIQHHYSSPQRSVLSTEMMSMSQISINGSPGSPHRRIARRKNPKVVSSRKGSGSIRLGN